MRIFKQYRLLSIATILVLVLATFSVSSTAHAGTYSLKSKKVPFGGKVLSVSIPAVTCTNTSGTAPVLLVSNLTNLASAGVTSFDKQQTTESRVANTASGLYKAIPLYTLDQSSATGKHVRQPKPGDWILGMQEFVPDVSTCKLDLGKVQVPFPVAKTSDYGLSENMSQPE